jgi:hypothetical protein
MRVCMPRLGLRTGRHLGVAWFALLLILPILASGCDGVTGGGLGNEDMSGIYEAQDDSGDRIEFKGERVYITFNPAPTMVGEYELDDDKVILTISGGSGQSIVLTRKGDALEGAPFRKAFIKK